MMERIAYAFCPLCEGQERTEVKVADCFEHPLYDPLLPPLQRWLRCNSCGHEYTDGYFGAEALKVLMKRSHSFQSPGHELIQQRASWAAVLDRIPVQSGRWLDVGFGDGSLMTTAAEYGFEVSGLDVREVNVILMRRSGFDVHAQEFGLFQPEEPFDVISMCDALEHMPFPASALKHAHSLISDNGLLLLSMPNKDSFLWAHMTATNQNPYWSEIEHYHNFGRKRLYDLLREYNFLPLRYSISSRYLACMEVLARRVER